MLQRGLWILDAAIDDRVSSSRSAVPKTVGSSHFNNGIGQPPSPAGPCAPCSPSGASF